MATLTPAELLSATLDTIKVKVPMLMEMSTDLSSDRAYKGQTIKAHIKSLPTVGDYDGNAGGYFANSVDGQALYQDIDVTLDSHKHVTFNLSHLNAISDEKRNDDISDSAYVLGKAMLDSVLAKATAANIPTSEDADVANSDFDLLNSVRSALNTQGADTGNRYGLVNSDVALTLAADTRIASKDFTGQEPESNGLGIWRGVAGFQQIIEYPDLPDNGENMTGLYFDPRAICLATRLPNDSTELAAQMGITNAVATEVVTDPDTGFSLLGITQMEPGTLDLYFTVAAIWGSAVGGAATAAAAIRSIDTP